MASHDLPPRLAEVGGDPYIVACWWARRRFPVIPVGTKTTGSGKWIKDVPLKSPEKGGPVPPDHPLGLRRGGPSSGGFHQATCDEGMLRRYFPEGCQYLVGTPGRIDLVILDWDEPGGEERWLAANPELASDYRHFRSRTFCVQTRQDQPDRVHVYAGLQPGMQAPLRAGSDQFAGTNARNCGLDIKSGTSGEGLIEGFVVLPGSGPRPDGHGEYAVLHGAPDAIEPIPVQLYHHLTVPDGGARVERDTATGTITRRTVSLKPSRMSRSDRIPTRPIGPGQRYAALRNIGRDPRYRSLDDALIFAAEFNRRFCQPPHPPDELERCVGEGWKWRERDEARKAAEQEQEPPPRAAEEDTDARRPDAADDMRPPKGARQAKGGGRDPGFDPSKPGDYRAAVAHIGCEILTATPGDSIRIRFPGEDPQQPAEWKAGNTIDSRLAVALREGARTHNDLPFAVGRSNDRIDFIREAARLNPVDMPHLVDEDYVSIEGTILGCPGVTRVLQILGRADVAHRTENAAQAKYLQALTRRIFRLHGWTPSGSPVRAYHVWHQPEVRGRQSASLNPRDMDSPGWRLETGLPVARVYVPPAGWRAM